MRNNQNIKRNAATAGLIILPFFFMYFAIAFTFWEWTISTWTNEARGFCVIMATIISLILMGINKSLFV